MLLVFGDVFSFFPEFFRFDYALGVPLFYFSLALGIFTFLLYSGLLFSNVILHTPLRHHLLLSLLDCVSLGFLLLGLESLRLLLVFLIGGAIPLPHLIALLFAAVPLRYLFFD